MAIRILATTDAALPKKLGDSLDVQKRKVIEHSQLRAENAAEFTSSVR